MSTPTIQMTQEQLQQLIESIRIDATADAAPIAVTCKTKGSFSKCLAYFYEGERDREIVETFITSIITYKEVESISDEDALVGFTLLLHDTALTWWLGIRKEAKTWADAIALLREHFSPARQCHQLYMEIFEQQQEVQTPIDTFICQKRALLAQLPEGRHDEETELDMIYALLNIKYRRHIARQEIKSFRDLLEKGRIIEHNNEVVKKTIVSSPVRAIVSKEPKRCDYCTYRGHTEDECRKRKGLPRQMLYADL